VRTASKEHDSTERSVPVLGVVLAIGVLALLVICVALLIDAVTIDMPSGLG
jgi:hypothetical protein